VGVVYNQTAVVVELFLVLQVTYESLLQSGYILESWSGLVLFGKYSYGYNVSSIITTTPDTLTTLNLDIALFNTLNISAGIFTLATLIPLSIFLYESISYKLSKDKELDDLAD
jgi:hypothetical protein